MERIREETEKLKWPVYERGEFDRGSYTKDLTKVEGSGVFPCQVCGRKIDPDDKSEENYVIIEPIVKDGDELEAVDIGCKCRNVIRITGFNKR